MVDRVDREGESLRVFPFVAVLFNFVETPYNSGPRPYVVSVTRSIYHLTRHPIVCYCSHNIYSAIHTLNQIISRITLYNSSSSPISGIPSSENDKSPHPCSQLGSSRFPRPFPSHNIWSADWIQFSKAKGRYRCHEAVSYPTFHRWA